MHNLAILASSVLLAATSGAEPVYGENQANNATSIAPLDDAASPLGHNFDGSSYLPEIPSDESFGPPDDAPVNPSDPASVPPEVPHDPSVVFVTVIRSGGQPPTTYSLDIPTAPKPANPQPHVPHPPEFTYDASELHPVPTQALAVSKAPPVITQTIRYWNTSIARTEKCTGCVLEAYYPITASYEYNDTYNPWTSLVVTETVLTQFVTYFHNGTIDTVTSELTTLNQTKTVVDTEMNKTITHSTPAFTITPTPGVYLTMDAGPTYVIYNTFFGGLDESNDRIHGHKTVRSCGNPLTSVEIEAPTKTEDWSYFIATYTDQAPSPVYDQPLALPTKLIDFLKLDTDIQEQFLGSDIATCTLRPTPTPSLGPGGPGSRPPAPAIPGFPSVTTGTFISTSYASTSTHVTRQGCLRCDNLQPSVPLEPTPKVNGGITDGDGYIASPGPTPQPNQNNPDPSPKASSNNKPNDKPNTNHNDDPNIISNNNPNNNDNPNNHPKPNAPSNPANIPDLLASIINNQPTVWPQHTQGPSITIGDDVFPINKPKQTQYNDNQHDSDLKIPIIVIGTNTLKPGETRTINGVPVVAPTNGGASQIIVNGHTVAYNFPPSPTGPPVLTVGQNTVTANPQGQFIFGTATLKPGGPAVILAGSTFSLAPGGPIAIINGVTQTLHNAPAPTAAPALTLANGQIIPITTVNNQPAYVLAPDQTLLPGSALTVSGTTYSLPASGSGTIVVINGQTSTIASPADAYVTAAPVLTINGQTYPATVVDGTTQYEIAPGTTLRPGEAVTMGGTTYSLDTAGTALVVDGQTSRISLSRVPASTSASTTGSRSTSTRGMGDLIASGIGEGRGSSSSSRAAGARGRGFSLDGWIESVIMGVAGWMVWLL